MKTPRIRSHYGYNKFLLSLLTLVSMLLAAQSPKAEINIYVVPVIEVQHTATNSTVSMTTTKTSNKQFANNKLHSLAEAIDLVNGKALRDATGQRFHTINIYLAPGRYPHTSAINLNAAFSGNRAHPVNIIGPEDASAVISGTQIIKGHKPISDSMISARLPKTARNHVLQADLPGNGIRDFGAWKRRGWYNPITPMSLELYFKRQPAIMARWPNTGYAKILTIPDGKDGLVFSIAGADGKKWAGEPYLLSTGYWSKHWSDETIPVDAVDPNYGTIKLNPPSPKFGMKTGQPVFMQHALSELDQPGEWYLDRGTGQLYFWPPSQIGAEDVEVSIANNLLVIDGANHINISGITLEGARGDGLIIRNANDVKVSNATIRNIGNRAAVIGGKDNGLSNVVIENINEGGIILDGGDRRNLTPGGLYVENSTIRRFNLITRTVRPAVRINGVGNRVSGNTIYDAPHSAIMFLGNDHVIANNHIFDVCKETGDAGAIYTGRDWTAQGTIISDNRLHSIPANMDKGGTVGIYLDDQASGITVRNNQIDGMNLGVQIGGGRNNLIEGNILSNQATAAIHLDARGTTWQKEHTDDPTWTLRTRLKDIPYASPIYRKKYPNLAQILDDEPGAPKYNIIRNNRITGTKTLRIQDRADSYLGTKVPGAQ